MENIPAEQLFVLREEVAAESGRAFRRAELEKRDRTQSKAYDNFQKKRQDLTNLSTGAGGWLTKIFVVGVTLKKPESSFQYNVSQVSLKAQNYSLCYVKGFC